MWNMPSAGQLNHIPRLNETESVPLKDKLDGPVKSQAAFLSSKA